MTEQNDIEAKRGWDWMFKNWPDDIPETAKAVMFLAYHLNDEEGQLSSISYDVARGADAIERIADAVEKIEKRGRPDPMYGFG